MQKQTKKNREIFDPHRCANIASLVGHGSSVSRVLLNNPKHQLISVSIDKVIKIWDTRTFRCLQTIHDTNNYQPENRITSAFYDENEKKLVTCSNQIVTYKLKSHVQRVKQILNFFLFSVVSVYLCVYVFRAQLETLES